MSERIISEDKEKNEIVIEVEEKEIIVTRDEILSLDMIKEIRNVKTKKKKRKI